VVQITDGEGSDIPPRCSIGWSPRCRRTSTYLSSAPPLYKAPTRGPFHMEDKRLAHNRKLEVTGKKQQRKKSNNHQLVATAVRPFHGRAESCPGRASQTEPPTTRESADRQQDQPPPPPHQQEADRELLLQRCFLCLKELPNDGDIYM
jgi:hypothetical protein